MNDLNDLLKTGEKILNEVDSALSSGDYSNLGNSIRGQVTDAVNRASSNPSQNFRGSASAVRTTTYASARFKSPFFRKKISPIKGILKIVFGALGAIYNGFFALACVVATSSEIYAIVPAIIFLALTGLFGYLIYSGIEDRKLKTIYDKYGTILGRSEYFAIDDLALAAAERPGEVRKNIKKLVKKNFLPSARMDVGETTVMLSDRAYEQYMQAELARKNREKFENRVNLEKTAQKEQSAQQPAPAAASKADDKVSGIIREGREYIENIRELNNRIPGDEMTNKLYKLENIMERIFTQVEKEPECADDLRKFMNYYLPTTTKLLTAYADLDRQPEAGNNIVKTKKDIEDTIDVINDAFENLLDSLFQNMAWDISSDISVMKTMMAQDGLTNNGFGAPQPQRSASDMSQPAMQFNASPQAQASQALSQGQMQSSPQLSFGEQGGAQSAEAQQTKTELKF